MNAPDFAPSLPWSGPTEQAVLGFLLDGGAFDQVQPLTAAHFYDGRHSVIFAAVSSMTARRLPVDVVGVFEHLQGMGLVDDAGGLPYINEVGQCGVTSRTVGVRVRTVLEMARRRALVDAARVAMEIASAGGSDVATLTDQIASLFVGLQREQIACAPRSLAEAVLVRTEHLEAVERGAVEPGWRTGIPGLDRLLGGGLRPGAVYILAARPSIGKSSKAQWLGMQQARAGRPCLFLSQEMPEAELADRGLSSAGQIDADALQTGGMTRDDWARIVELQEAPELRNFYVDDQPALTLLDVRAKAKQVKGLKVLILDYLQLCAGSSGREANRNTELEQISRGLKQLAKEMGIAVIALSQLNRKVEERASKRPILADLRDSGAIEQDADVVAMLWTARDLGNGCRLVGMDLPKNRQGRTGEVALHFDGAHQSWGESTEDLKALSVPSTGRRRGFGDGD